MSAQDVVDVLGAIAALPWPAAFVVIAAIFGFVAWKRLPGTKELGDVAGKILHELKPNSGKSLRDQTNRMEAEIQEIKAELKTNTVMTSEQGSTLSAHIEASEADRADLRERIEAVPAATAEAVASE